MSIGDRIKKAREEKRISQAVLAAASGVNQSLIARYEKGSVRNMSQSHLKKLADALDKPISWFHEEDLSVGETSPLAKIIDELLRPPNCSFTEPQVQALIEFFREFKRQPESSRSAYAKLPQLSPQQKETELSNFGEHLQEAKIHRLPVLKVEHKAAAGPGEYIEIPPEPLLLAQHRWRKGFKPFRITGDSMEPFIMNGDYVVVDLVRPPVDGDTVLARIADGLVVKKFYNKKNLVELVSINPEYAPIKTKDVMILGVLIDIVRPLKKV